MLTLLNWKMSPVLASLVVVKVRKEVDWNHFHAQGEENADRNYILNELLKILS